MTCETPRRPCGGQGLPRSDRAEALLQRSQPGQDQRVGSRRESRREGWDRFWRARPVEEVYEAIGEVCAEILRQRPVAGSRILEVGCGSGRDALRLAEAGANVTALDYSAGALAAVRQACRTPARCHLVQGNALALPFRDGTFDVVFHQGLLEHFPDPAPVLAENVRVLKPGGMLLVDVPQRWHYYTLAKKLLIAMDRWFAGWERSFSATELERLVEAAGLVHVTTYASWPRPGLPYRALRLGLARFGITLPMRPAVLRRAGAALYALQDRLRYRRAGHFTAMVIGVVARKPGGP